MIEQLMDSIDSRAAIVLAVAVTAVAFDLRTRRIPNVLTFGAALLALAYGLFSDGWSGLGTAALGWCIGAVLFFPLFALRGMGAGDVKLIAALGAWLGPIDVVWLAIFTSIAGGFVALIVSVAHGYLRQAFANVWLMLMHWRVAGPRPVPGLTLRDARAPRLAFAVPIAIGALCTLWRG